MNKVELNDFKAQWAMVQSDVLAAVERVGQSGWLILGNEVRLFEAELAKRWDLPEAVGCANGLDALEIGLHALGIRAGDPVLTTPLSAFATTLAIQRAGGKPVFVDTDANGLIDLDAVENTLKSRTDIRFLIPVHLYGFPLDLGRLAQIKKTYSIKIIEDCAQSIDARWNGAQTGTVGDIAATSFYPTKNLGCYGDGGALLSRDASLIEAAKQLRDYGQSSKYVHSRLGMNSRLDELQAALLRTAILPRLDEWNLARRRIAQRYQKEISNPSILLPYHHELANPSWHLYPVQIPTKRKELQSHLAENGIASGIHYPGLITQQDALKNSASGFEIVAPLPRAETLIAQELSLPIHPFLRDADVDRVISACNRWKAT